VKAVIGSKCQLPGLVEFPLPGGWTGAAEAKVYRVAAASSRLRPSHRRRPAVALLTRNTLQIFYAFHWIRLLPCQKKLRKTLAKYSSLFCKCEMVKFD